eukprot:scaffold6420_cov168-Amphora_coffeaeformis.AAC.14
MYDIGAPMFWGEASPGFPVTAWERRPAHLAPEMFVPLAEGPIWIVVVVCCHARDLQTHAAGQAIVGVL